MTAPSPFQQQKDGIGPDDNNIVAMVELTMYVPAIIVSIFVCIRLGSVAVLGR
jgi:hypothetical protein